MLLQQLGLDRKLNHLLFARRRGALEHAVVASSEALPFGAGAVDWSLSTLLLHHFDAREGRVLLEEMVRVARRGAAIVDLRRSWLARALIRVLLPLLGVARVAAHDGRVSADAAWSLAEARELAVDLPLDSLERRFPFRFSLVVQGRPAENDRRAIR